LEILDSQVAENYRKKISGFETKNQLKQYLSAEPQPKEKVALGYVRSKDLGKLKKTNTFYFHATDKQGHFIDFPYEINNAKKLIIYSGGRTKPFYLTSYCAEIESIKIKHKSKIEGKENSKTEYYFEVQLKELFVENNNVNLDIDLKKLIKQYCKENQIKSADYKPILLDEVFVYK
jgi:hypothetical protein